MKIVVKNQELESLLFFINGNENIKGLANEGVTLGTQLRLSKITKALSKEFGTYNELKDKLVKELYPNELTKEEENKLIESKDANFLALIDKIYELLKEDVTVEFEGIKLEIIEDIKPSFNYAYLLEKICE